jgi:hypothetical protein
MNTRAELALQPAYRLPGLPGAEACREKFLRVFPQGFYDPRYLSWERGYKWNTHERWNEVLGEREFRSLLRKRRFMEVAERAVKIESKTHLLFSFEKMAIRDALKSPGGARLFANELYDFLYGSGSPDTKFERWCGSIGRLPRKQSRVLTWPLVTVFGFIAQPERHIFFKPKTTRAAALEYGFALNYTSHPSWGIYASLLDFVAIIRRDLRELRPRDMIDLQSFLWVLGSAEYDDWK